MDWVYCNKCSLKFQQSVKFYLSECGHICCGRCIENLKQLKINQNKPKEIEKCLICNKSTSVMQLSKDMNLTTQMYFWPLENMLQQSLQVSNFQAMHRNLFLEALNRKYSYAKRQCINYYNSHKKLQKENQLLREMLKTAGCDPPSVFFTSTPSNHSRPLSDNNASMLSSIRFTPAQLYHPENMVGSFTYGPSPAQMVPKGGPVPVHREAAVKNPAAATPNFMGRLRGKSGFPSLGYPRK